MVVEGFDGSHLMLQLQCPLGNFDVRSMVVEGFDGSHLMLQLPVSTR